MNMSPVLQVNNFSVGHKLDHQKEFTVLSGLNFTIMPGDLICLMGQNGCGKSTLLSALCGLNTCFSGKIEVMGRELQSFTQMELARAISIVLTDRGQEINLSVRDIVSLGRFPYIGRFAKLSESDLDLIDNSLQMMEIDDLSDRPFQELSDGQKQKVFLARALAQDTPIILLDEPTSFLDIPRKMELLILLNKVVEEKNTAILFSSHDWDLTLEMASLLWVIDDDKKINFTSPEDLILNGDVRWLFEHDDFPFDFKTGRFKIKRKELPVNLVIIGEEEQLIWTKHALRKCQLKENLKANVEIQCIDRQVSWLLTINGKQHQCNTLVELIYRLNFD